jgi:hypothetical protein
MNTKVKKTLADLHAAHDKNVMIPNRIRQALELLKASGDDWAYEPDFMALTKPGISAIDISKFRGQFTDFWAETPAVNGKNTIKRVWFASKTLANKWKETAGG